MKASLMYRLSSRTKRNPVLKDKQTNSKPERENERERESETEERQLNER